MAPTPHQPSLPDCPLTPHPCVCLPCSTVSLSLCLSTYLCLRHCILRREPPSAVLLLHAVSKCPCQHSVLHPCGGSLGPALGKVASPASCGGDRGQGGEAQPPHGPLGPHWPLPFTGLPEGGPPRHHGHLPAGAALRIPHQQVGCGWDCGGLLGPGGAKVGPHH